MSKKCIAEQHFLRAAVGLILLLSLLACSPTSPVLDYPCPRSSGQFADNSAVSVETIVVSAAADPYYPLAQKIAQAENLTIVEDFPAALNAHPRFILLVASPWFISNESLLAIGQLFQRLGDYPALGIITGSTIEKAEQLWARRDQVHAGSNYVAGDVEVYQQVSEPTIYDISEGSVEATELNKDNLIGVLKQADYLYWSRHAGAATWFWNSDAGTDLPTDKLRAWEIPALKPVVIYTPSCGTIRPRVGNNNIAMAFIDHGAAAFIGNANSPIANGFLRHGLEVPGITSWKEFPLGLVAQVHSKMTTRALFTAPQFFMLGDPRIYLSKDEPYQVLSDQVLANGKRVILGQSGIQGSLAIKIENGAQYDFLAVKGVTTASEGDLFYNSKLQTMNLGADKYLLLLHAGGPFEIELSRHAPFLWIFSDALWDAFDFSWVLLWLDVKVTDGIFVYLFPMVVFVVILLFKMLRRKKTFKDYRSAFWFGFLISFLRLGYFLLRRDDYSVSGNYVDYPALSIVLGCLGIFAAVSGGLILMRDARRIWGKFFGLLLAVLPQAMLAGFYLAFITLYNTLTPINNMTAPWLFNYRTFGMLAIVLLFEMALTYAAYRLVIASRDHDFTRWVNRKPSDRQTLFKS